MADFQNWPGILVKKLKQELNPLTGGFYFGLVSCILLGLLCFSSQGLAQLDGFNNSKAMFSNAFLGNADGSGGADLFFSKSEAVTPETPDLKLIQDSFVYGVSTPLALSPQTLGDIFGEPSQERKEVQEYEVQPGDTLKSITDKYNLSLTTLLSANNLSKNSTLKVGQTLVILPVDGVLYVVKSGDTLEGIVKTYKGNANETLALNDIAEGRIFIGDVLIIAGGVTPPKALPSIAIQTPLADSFFIYPAEGRISQGLHYYNGVDLANACGTPIYATAAGIVQRVADSGKWNAGKGNYITLLHSNGVSTYYGHLQSLFVKSGDQVNVGDRIGLMGKTGAVTGCHVHFQVMGAKNPLAKYSVGTVLQYK